MTAKTSTDYIIEAQEFLNGIEFRQMLYRLIPSDSARQLWDITIVRVAEALERRDRNSSICLCCEALHRDDSRANFCHECEREG